MALKFLNKKGWHTGSLRNIENVWKAEQKHEAEQRKLEELRKQIQDERERTEFRLLQEKAGLVPTQERLDFLYESGLAVGKGASDSGSGFKALEGPPAAATVTGGSETSGAKAAVPGALFEDKPQSANDAWRKLHSDPLLLIRQREQEALAKIKNNPIRMAMIRKSVEAEKKEKQGKKDKGKKRKHRKHQQSELKEERNSVRDHSTSDESSESEDKRQRRGYSPIKDHQSRKMKNENHSMRAHFDSEDTNGAKEDRREWDRDSSRYKGHQHHYSKRDKHSHQVGSDSEASSHEEDRRQANRSRSWRHHNDDLKNDKYSREVRGGPKHTIDYDEDRRKRHQSTSKRKSPETDHDLDNKHRATHICDRHQVPSNNTAHAKHREIIAQDERQARSYNRRHVMKLSEEERAARLREMQLDAEVHEEQRWKRVKKAAETDAQEAMQSRSSGGKNFIDAAHKSIFGTEKGGSSTIEESIRRRAFYSQGRSAASESNAFRR